MIMDAQNLFSDAQEVLVSAASTNIINMGSDDALIQSIVEKGRIDILVQVQTAFTVGTSLTVAVQVDDDEAFGSATTLATTAAIVSATLVAGYNIPISIPVANASEQYMRLYYTISGTMTTGNLDAGIILDRQTNGI